MPRPEPWFLLRFLPHIAALRAIDQRSHANIAAARLWKLQKVFARIAKCVRRSPAALRLVLDCEVRSCVRNTSIDLESMQVLIDRLIAGFALFPKEKTSLTVLRACVPESAIA